MPATETYSPARAAKQVGIPGSTLRHWARGYAEFLSPESNPEPGAERRFTPGDVEVLKAIAQLRANDLQPDEIKARLRANPATALQSPLGTPTTGAALPTVANTPHDAIQAFLERAQLTDDLKSIDQRLQRVESTRWWIVAVVLAFAAGGLVVGVVAWLAAQLGR